MRCHRAGRPLLEQAELTGEEIDNAMKLLPPGQSFSSVAQEEFDWVFNPGNARIPELGPGIPREDGFANCNPTEQPSPPKHSFPNYPPPFNCRLCP